MSVGKTKLMNFYNSYHQFNKSGIYSKIISRNNFTYYYFLEFIEKKYLKKNVKGRILDIGMGVGSLSLYFSQFSEYVLGLDISPDAISIANFAKEKLYIKNVEFRVSELKKKMGKFNFIICSEVLEHIEDENDFLRKIHSNLDDDGYLFISTPSRMNYLTRTGFFVSFDQKVGHLRRYTEDELVVLLRKNKFNVVELRSTEGILRLLLFTTKFGFLIRFIKGPLVKIFHFLDYYSIRFFGAHDIQLIAQKK